MSCMAMLESMSEARCVIVVGLADGLDCSLLLRVLLSLELLNLCMIILKSLSTQPPTGQETSIAAKPSMHTFALVSARLRSIAREVHIVYTWTARALKRAAILLSVSELLL